MTRDKAVRTRIEDLPEIAVELSEREMRIVSGGLTVPGLACSAIQVGQIGGSLVPRTSWNTNGDWDSDK